MSLPSRGIDPNLLTKSQVLPWLSSRFQVGTSRTFWVVIAIAMLIALLFNNNSYSYMLYMVAGMLVVVFLFSLKMFLRSNVSIFLLLFAFFSDYQLLKTAFWNNATASLDFFSRGIVDDLLILLPFGVLILLQTGLMRLSPTYVDDSTKAKLITWAGLGRATAVIMILASSGAAVAFNIVVDRYVVPQVVYVERDRLLDVVDSLPVDKNATMKYSYKGAPHKDPKSGELTRDHIVEMDYGDWRNEILPAVGGAAYLKGIKTMVPRMLIFLFGFGAYAALAGYLISRWRAHEIKVPRAIIYGIGALILLERLWSLFAAAPVLTVPSALLVAMTGVVLVAAGLKAIELDHSAGASDAGRLLGASFAQPSRAKGLSSQRPSP